MIEQALEADRPSVDAAAAVRDEKEAEERSLDLAPGAAVSRLP